MGKFLTTIGSWLGLVIGLDWLWRSLNIQDPPVVWAFTVVTFLAIGVLGLWLCALWRSILQQRIDDCAEAKKRLEQQILKNRQSSE
ncbi:hypothetical protein [Allochromatium palmeri]|uniref:Uncharacterized protein n=1 Tax=Allochromatium palmeri TaxID=231048 RepID=A0A6N8EEU7_9GAMM|nr:hypothetical protein [Allochromatium palmeri]MTW21156.1 hypothetical protein [Allochromatium palmeri]